MNDRRSEQDSSDVSRDDVRDYYSKAAVATQENLCCPIKYEPGDLSHVPKEALEISYGCGSPVNRANIHVGESLVDLGSGGGIDCFIAAKMVGAEGRVTGIDMTDTMLEAARNNAKKVADNLGFSNVEFKQGFLESIPMEDASATVVTSNCVVNLSTKKQDVFQEIHRILKPGGRFVIADIISDKPVPESMRQDKELWGECVSGSLTLDEFLTLAKKAGFHGCRVSKDYLWKDIEGIKFYSYILEGYKYNIPEDASCCKTVLALYSGPMTQVTCEDTVFPVGVQVEVDEEVAAVLAGEPYRSMFQITDPENETPEDSDDSCCG